MSKKTSLGFILNNPNEKKIISKDIIESYLSNNFNLYIEENILEYSSKDSILESESFKILNKDDVLNMSDYLVCYNKPDKNNLKLFQNKTLITHIDKNISREYLKEAISHNIDIISLLFISAEATQDYFEINDKIEVLSMIHHVEAFYSKKEDSLKSLGLSKRKEILIYTNNPENLDYLIDSLRQYDCKITLMSESYKILKNTNIDNSVYGKPEIASQLKDYDIFIIPKQFKENTLKTSEPLFNSVDFKMQQKPQVFCDMEMIETGNIFKNKPTFRQKNRVFYPSVKSKKYNRIFTENISIIIFEMLKEMDINLNFSAYVLKNGEISNPFSRYLDLKEEKDKEELKQKEYYRVAGLSEESEDEDLFSKMQKDSTLQTNETINFDLDFEKELDGEDFEEDKDSKTKEEFFDIKKEKDLIIHEDGFVDFDTEDLDISSEKTKTLDEFIVKKIGTPIKKEAFGNNPQDEDL